MAEPLSMGDAQRMAAQKVIGPDRAWLWLTAGWQDLARAPFVGLSYGALIVAASWIIVLALHRYDLIYLFLPATGGFFLVAPLLAAGLYDTSRRLERGQPVDLATALFAWRAPGQITLMGAVLLLLHLAWVRVALLLFMLFFPGKSTALPDLVNLLLFSPQSIPFLVTGTVIGLGFAVVAFAISAVSIPMLVDREIGVIGAIATSIAVVRRNWQAMALWAALIVVFTAAGLATMFVGLALVVPLVGHATWHAYRETVDAKGLPARE